MINIEIQKLNGKTIGFEIKGHSGYSEQGSDIVCSAVSSTSQMVCVGLENVLKLKPAIKIDEKNAYLSCRLNVQEVSEKTQLLFDSFEKTMELLLCGDKTLKKYIKLEVKNEIY